MKAKTYTVQMRDGKIFTVRALNAEQAMDIAYIKGLEPIKALEV